VGLVGKVPVAKADATAHWHDAVVPAAVGAVVLCVGSSPSPASVAGVDVFV
jgi:hypothetical protein